jgi:hypothetical protein
MEWIKVQGLMKFFDQPKRCGDMATRGGAAE